MSVSEWVRREFRDTDQDIGLDEGFQAPGLDTSRVTDMGAGASVDRVFSIWQRNVPGATTVVLGSMRIDATTLTPRQVAASMYGIAAVPWVQEQGLRN